MTKCKSGHSSTRRIGQRLDALVVGESKTANRTAPIMKRQRSIIQVPDRDGVATGSAVDVDVAGRERSSSVGWPSGVKGRVWFMGQLW